MFKLSVMPPIQDNLPLVTGTASLPYELSRPYVWPF